MVVSAWREPTPLKRSAPAAKLFSARLRGLKPWAKTGFGLRSQGDDGDGDAHDGGGSTPSQPRGCVCEAQRCRGAESLHPRLRGTQQDILLQIAAGCRYQHMACEIY